MFLDELREKALNDDKLAEINAEIDKLESDLYKLKEQAYDCYAEHIFGEIKKQITKEVEDGKYSVKGNTKSIDSKIEFDVSFDSPIDIDTSFEKRILGANTQIRDKDIQRDEVWIGRYHLIEGGSSDEQEKCYNGDNWCNEKVKITLINDMFRAEAVVKREGLFKKQCNEYYLIYNEKELYKKMINKILDLATENKIKINYYLDIRYSAGKDDKDNSVKSAHIDLNSDKIPSYKIMRSSYYNSAKLVFEYSLNF